MQNETRPSTADHQSAAESVTSPVSAGSETLLECSNVWKVFGPNGQLRAGGYEDTPAFHQHLRAQGAVPAICDVSFSIRRSEIFIIMGLSGSGKSTLLRCLSRLVEPDAGQILFAGQDILTLGQKQLSQLRREKFGMVFQGYGLLGHLNARDNVAFPLRVQGVGRAERLRRADELLELVGLGDRKTNFPGELSGGQQQRVGIARSLITDPDLWFLDEPFSALDPLIRRQMQAEFLNLQRRLGKTIVFVTHDILEATKLGDRIAIMREGRIVQCGTPADIILNPVDDYVRDFVADVPADRVLKVSDLMRPAGTQTDGAESIAADASIESALTRFLSGSERLRVVSACGKTLGEIARSDIAQVSALRDVA